MAQTTKKREAKDVTAGLWGREGLSVTGAFKNQGADLGTSKLGSGSRCGNMKEKVKKAQY